MAVNSAMSTERKTGAGPGWRPTGSLAAAEAQRSSSSSAEETRGRLDAQECVPLASFVSMCSGYQPKRYVKAMRELLDSVTVAVAKSVATTLLNEGRVTGEILAPEAGEEDGDAASMGG